MKEIMILEMSDGLHANNNRGIHGKTDLLLSGELHVQLQKWQRDLARTLDNLCEQEYISDGL